MIRAMLLASLLSAGCGVTEETDAGVESLAPDEQTYSEPRLVGLIAEAHRTGGEHWGGVQCGSPSVYAVPFTGDDEDSFTVPWGPEVSVPCDPLERAGNAMSLHCTIEVRPAWPPWYSVHWDLSLYRNGFTGALSGSMSWTVDGDNVFGCYLLFQVPSVVEIYEE